MPVRVATLAAWLIPTSSALTIRTMSEALKPRRSASDGLRSRRLRARAHGGEQQDRDQRAREEQEDSTHETIYRITPIRRTPNVDRSSAGRLEADADACTR